MTKQLIKIRDLPGSRRQILKNESIWEPEDPADKLYLVETGRIKIIQLNGDGSEILLEIIETDEFFGEACFIKPGQRKTMAVALSDCSIAEFSVQEFLELVRENQHFFEYFIASVSRRKIGIENRIAVLSSRKVENRLGNILIHLAAEKGIRMHNLPSSKIKVFVTHEELADLTAASRQRVTKTMNYFRKIGLVEYGRTKPLIINIPVLENYLENVNNASC